MSGSAGSKYGITKDGVPVKPQKQHKPRKKLKSLRRILKRKNSQKEG